MFSNLRVTCLLADFRNGSSPGMTMSYSEDEIPCEYKIVQAFVIHLRRLRVPAYTCAEIESRTCDRQQGVFFHCADSRVALMSEKRLD